MMVGVGAGMGMGGWVFVLCGGACWDLLRPVPLSSISSCPWLNWEILLMVPESLEQRKEGKAQIIHPSTHHPSIHLPSISLSPHHSSSIYLSIHPSTPHIHTATSSQFSMPATRLMLRIQSLCLCVYTSNNKFFPIQHGGKGTNFNCSWAYVGMLISVSQFCDKNVFKVFCLFVFPHTPLHLLSIIVVHGVLYNS